MFVCNAIASDIQMNFIDKDKVKPFTCLYFVKMSLWTKNPRLSRKVNQNQNTLSQSMSLVHCATLQRYQMAIPQHFLFGPTLLQGNRLSYSNSCMSIILVSLLVWDSICKWKQRSRLHVCLIDHYTNWCFTMINQYIQSSPFSESCDHNFLSWKKQPLFFVVFSLKNGISIHARRVRWPRKERPRTFCQ